MRTRNWSPSVLFVDTEDTFPLSITTASDKLGHMNLMPVHGLNVYSMVKHHTLVITKRAVEVIIYNKTRCQKIGNYFSEDH